MDEPENGSTAPGCDSASDEFKTPTASQSQDEYVNIHLLIEDRREVVSFRPDCVNHEEIKDLFRSAAEAGPLDIVKLRKGERIVNISPHLTANTSEDPYVLEVIAVHPSSSGMLDLELLRTLERRVEALERELQDQHDLDSAVPCAVLRDLRKQVDSFKQKLETAESLRLGTNKTSSEPTPAPTCRRFQYRRKCNAAKRKVREKFFKANELTISQEALLELRSPAFDARQWDDHELLFMLQTMFVELDLPQKFKIPMQTLRNFLFEVYNNYNEVPFHNFRHCFCVAQMMYVIVWATDLITKIGDLEVLILIVSCICHDLDHPGYNNIYQINARTELAIRYNDISPLENHHCSVAFLILELSDCNIFSSLSKDTFKTIREGIIRCILATDMARHNTILGEFSNVVPEFDFTNKAQVNLLAMVLIKVADISNEARPMDVAEPWLDNLLQEFFKQSDAEKLEGLPVTPFMDRDKVTKPSSQCSFIGLVLLPLFEILGDLFPELVELIVEPARFALEYYRRLDKASKDERHQRKSVADLGEHATSGGCTPGSGSTGSGHQLHHSSGTGGFSPGSCVVKSVSMHSVRSRRSINTLHGSRSIEADDLSGSHNQLSHLQQLQPDTLVEGESSSDPETATEVEVSEKTLKFKISTEGGGGSGGGTSSSSSNAPGRKSYPGSRKGSRDKTSFLEHANNSHELTRAVREHERERRRSRGENLSSDVGSPASARSGSNDENRILEELERGNFEGGGRQRQRVVELVVGDEVRRTEGNAGFVRTDTAQQSRKNRLNKRTVSVDSSEREVRIATNPAISPTSPTQLVKHVVRCCCEDKSGPNNHKSLFSRLRNFTDRLSISFDNKDVPTSKMSDAGSVGGGGKCLSPTTTTAAKNPFVTNLGSSTTKQQQQQQQPLGVCKKCNLSKNSGKNGNNGGGGSDALAEEKRSMTLPKAKRSQDCKNKSWRTVFAKEKRPSISLETLPAVTPGADSIGSPDSTGCKHRRNLSNPEGKLSPAQTASSPSSEQPQMISFPEIDVRPTKPEIHVDAVNPGSSGAVEDIGKVEIRRSSASMEDISKITKQQGELCGSLEQQCRGDESQQQYAGSLDSMLLKEPKSQVKPVALHQASSPAKKSSGLFSRFKSGMSIDAGSSGSSIHEQTQQQHSSTGWISSLTASFRPRRQGEQQPASSPTSREEIK